MRSSVAMLAVLTVVVAACSSSGSEASSQREGKTGAPTSTVPRPGGPAAKVSPLRGGNGIRLVSPTKGPDLQQAGYVENEYAVSGTATAYTLANRAKTFPENGRFPLEAASKASYATRMVVRRPKDPAAFDGTVVVEWNNVSGGLDVAPDWTYTADEIVRSGAAWVGVSAQMIGIEGGPVAVMTPASKLGGAGKGLKAEDPARYGKLHHPGDAYAYDIYTQVARAIRANAGPVKPLGGDQPEVLLAMGESQSAFALTTYYDGFQPRTRAFDGFLVHSRGGAALPLGKPGKPTDIAAAVTDSHPVRFRTDLRAPLIAVETETDVLGILRYLPAQQADSDTVRIWEVAGTSHVDQFQLGKAVAKLFGCAEPVNAGPDHFVVADALAKLDAWVRRGTAPPHAPRLKIDAKGTDYVRDANGIAKGGIRTPQVDVPVDVLSGLPASTDSPVACLLAGSTTPIPESRLSEMYPSRAAYLSRYTKAADAAIASGFVLPTDRAELLADARPDRIPE